MGLISSAKGIDWLIVIVSSVMTIERDTRSWITDPKRAWFAKKLADEVEQVRSRGAAVVVIEPDAATAEGLSTRDPESRLRALRGGQAAVDRMLDDYRSDGIRSLINRAG